MAFQKGQGGRKDGAVNKVTQATREAFQLLVDKNFSKLQKWIDQTATEDPARAFDMVMDLASHCIPKLKAIEHSGEIRSHVTVSDDIPAK
jgi:hypothetical protein